MKKLLNAYFIMLYSTPIILTILAVLRLQSVENSLEASASSEPPAGMVYFDLFFWVIVVSSCLAVLFALAFIVNAFFFQKKLKSDIALQRVFNQRVLKYKLLAIPFFVLNYLFWIAAFILGGFIFFFEGLIVIALPWVVIYTYIAMLSTSLYAIKLLHVMYKNRQLTLNQFMLHFFLQFCFVLDMVDYIYLYFKFKKLYGKEEPPISTPQATDSPVTNNDSSKG